MTDEGHQNVITVGLIICVCFASIIMLLKPKQKAVVSIQESLEIANIVESEPLPEIIIPDPILPRALPPLVEGGEVYFEEL